MLRRGDFEAFDTPRRHQFDRREIERAEPHRAFAARDDHRILRSGGRSDEAPHPRTGHARTEAERRRDGVRHVVESPAVGLAPPGIGDLPEQEIEDVERMGRHVAEIALPADLAAQPPRKTCRIAVPGALRTEIAHLDAQHLADGPAVEQLLHFQEVGQRPAVIGDKEPLPGAFRRGDHVEALRMVHRHRLLDVDGFSGGQHLQGEFPVAVGRGCDVDDVHAGIGNQRIGVGITLRHAVPAGEIGSLGGVAAHNGREGGMRGLVHRRAALAFANVAAAQDAPIDVFHTAIFRSNGGIRPVCARRGRGAKRRSFRRWSSRRTSSHSRRG